MESAAPQTPVQALEALQNAYSRFLDALPEARRASLGEAIGFFLRSDGNPKLGSLVDAFAEELPVHVEALKTRLAACPAEEADRLATQALELMLLYPRPKDGATEFSLDISRDTHQVGDYVFQGGDHDIRANQYEHRSQSHTHAVDGRRGRSQGRTHT